MKKNILFGCIVVLVLSLIFAGLFTIYIEFLEESETIINTKDEAIILAKAYLQIRYPEITFDDCGYFVYKDDGDWVVWCNSSGTGNTDKLPGVHFKVNGEFIFAGLPKD